MSQESNRRNVVIIVWATVIIVGGFMVLALVREGLRVDTRSYSHEGIK